MSAWAATSLSRLHQQLGEIGTEHITAQVHTLSATYGEAPRLLRLRYAWLADHPTDAGIWVQAHGIAADCKIRPDTYMITINEDGTTRFTPLRRRN